MNLAVSKIAPALMCGNAIVLKPPTQGAVGAVHMVQCFNKAGFPEGVINLVTGRGSEIGDYLTTHPKVKHLLSSLFKIKIGKLYKFYWRRHRTCHI